jgi:hypothetical protein
VAALRLHRTMGIRRRRVTTWIEHLLGWVTRRSNRRSAVRVLQRYRCSTAVARAATVMLRRWSSSISTNRAGGEVRVF